MRAAGNTGQARVARHVSQARVAGNVSQAEVAGAAGGVKSRSTAAAALGLTPQCICPVQLTQ